MTRDQIKAIALAHGFTERQQADGSMDLNGYVYAFAEAIYADGQRAMRDRAETACRTVKIHVDGYHLFTANKVRGECSLAVQRMAEVKP